MTLTVSNWSADVERGPDWLFIRLHLPDDKAIACSGLAADLWNVLQQHFATRVVLELDEISVMRSSLIGELVRLHKRISSAGGLMRISGLADGCQEALHATHLDVRFPQFANRTDAVMGSLRKPK